MRKLRMAGLVVGVLGALAAALLWLLMIVLGGLATQQGYDSDDLVSRAMLVLVAAAIGGAGALFGVARPRAAALLMLGATVLGVIAASFLFALSAALFIAAAAMCYLGRKTVDGRTGVTAID